MCTIQTTQKPARSITRPARANLRPLDQLQPHFGARLARFDAASESRVAALRHRRVDEREVLPRAAVVARPRGYVRAGHCLVCVRVCMCGGQWGSGGTVVKGHGQGMGSGERETARITENRRWHLLVETIPLKPVVAARCLQV